jgi:CubicO group peptidase (beta-lactamase class C family)/beta-glucosidase-like glycosyl hydrolase
VIRKIDLIRLQLQNSTPPTVKKVSLRTIVILVMAVLFTQSVFAQNDREKWVDSVFQTLNTEEKIGQLIMVRVPSNSEEDQENLFDNIRSHRIGGAIIMKGGPVSHARIVNRAQKNSRVPMFFGIEATSGVGQAIDSILTFSHPLVLSAVRNDSIVYEVGKEIASEMKTLGLHINFSPQANFDYRSDDYPGTLMHYSDNKERVQKKSLLFVKALQDNGIIACAQHQPFHKDAGGTVKLLHEGAPDKTLFEPYQFLIDNGLKAIRTTNLPYFYVEKKNETLTGKISRIFISEQIKRSLGFTGLTFTDIPDLQQIVEKPRGGETEALAFQMGNDILIDPRSISSTIRKLKKDLKKNLPLQHQLDATVRKILAAKYDAGLGNWQPINTENLVRRLNPLSAKLLQQKAIRKAITLVENQNNALPISALENKRFASITIGKEQKNDFTRTLSKYNHFDHYGIRSPADTASLDLDIINRYDYVVIAVFPYSTSFLPSIKNFLAKVRPGQKIICHFGDPLQLNQFADLTTAITAYSDNPISEKTAAQMIFGAMTFEGELPVSINHSLMEGRGLSIDPVQRFSYVMPEEAGMDSKTLEQISYIARQAIDSLATPGCHVFVARRGKVVFDRSFGWYTYDNKIPVTDETLYDLASITKVAATLQAVMFLEEKGMIDVHKKASMYLPSLLGTNKKDITIKDMLTHQSGLLPFIPMWPNTFDKETKKVPNPYYYSSSKSEHYPLQVAPELFVSPSIRDSAWHWVMNSKMIDRQPRTPYSYRYSDMASMIFQYMVEYIVNQPMNEFLQDHFYEPLGAETLGYLPLERFDPSRVAPTEIDTIYRKQLVHGTVHDERAAMLGGVAGHAGLFGNANDLAKIGQMLLNKGSYGGVQFFKPETVERFTSKQYENSRRGLGWDKPTVGDWNGPTSPYASPLTFGHTGFTGTCIWVDPAFDLVFVFLSNRVWPDRSSKLLNANIRTRIQEVVYKSIFNYSQFQD